MFVFGSGVSHKACLYSDARAVYRACVILGFDSSSGPVVSVLLLVRLRGGGAGVGLRLLWGKVGVVSRVWLVLRGFCLRLLVLGLGVFGLREGRLLGGGGGGMELVDVCSCCLERLRGLTFLGGGGGGSGGVLGWELVDCVCDSCC